MTSSTPISKSLCLLKNTQYKTPSLQSTTSVNLGSGFLPKRGCVRFQFRKTSGIPGFFMKAAAVVVSATTTEMPKKRYPGEAKGFVEEMRFVAMKLHTKEQSKEGEKEVKEPQEGALIKWEPTIDGYLKFLVDSKLVYDTLESIIEEAPFSYCK